MSDRSSSPPSHRVPRESHGGRTIAGRDTNSNDPKSLRCRLFIGNLATDKTTKVEVEEIFSKFGELASLSLHNNFGFVQFIRPEDADKAVEEMHGTQLFGKRIDVNLAGERRKLQVRNPPVDDDFASRAPRRDRSPHRSDRSRDSSSYNRGEPGESEIFEIIHIFLYLKLGLNLSIKMITPDHNLRFCHNLPRYWITKKWIGLQKNGELVMWTVMMLM